MLTLYITRHGETVWNTQKRMQGWKDSPLTETGRQNAFSLGERLAHIPFRAVYSSPSGRTKETASLICGEGKFRFSRMEIYVKLISENGKGKLKH